MKTEILNDNWEMKVIGKNVYDIPGDPISTKAPSTVYGTLLEHRLMPDPFYRDNELDATKLMDNDFEYTRDFTVSGELRAKDRVFLKFDGIDTLADIYLGDTLLGSADNMNRIWEFDITDFIRGDAAETVYHLRVVLHSPTKFIKDAYEKDPIGGSDDAMPGFPHIRKAACMFGWDWGPRLPDAGLFRPVSLNAYTTARIESVLIRQVHHVTGKTVHGNTVDSVTLTADAHIEWMPEAGGKAVKAVFKVTSPEGETFVKASDPVKIGRHTAPSDNLTGLDEPLQSDHVKAEVRIDDPKLWWPNGYGDQTLYKAEVVLVPADAAVTWDGEISGAEESGTKEEAVLDTWEKKIGLRTMTVNTDLIPDETFDPHMTDQQPDLDDGDNMLIGQGGKTVAVIDKQVKKVPSRNFAFEVNGLQIFAMGGDYIPEDNVFQRLSRERSDLLLKTAQESHYNCIRIWGGGYFPDDYLYEICDERGILIWQDFMFACAAYELSDSFTANITAEIRTQMRRLRSHPCMALWCGNNETETEFEVHYGPKTPKQMYDYIRMYEEIFPKVVKAEDPDAFYWPSSPSSGGNFHNSNAENVGDVHYWGVWHGSEPFTAYRKHHYRFLSEFGFQSFPAVQTIDRFTEPGDRNIFSRVMEMHQRNTAANGKILNYLSATYLYPKSFDDLVYCSQLLQADAIRYGVEHFRRFRGTCMGTIVWQLDDIWPVASWASVDYYGNWKALQYAEKRAFAPVMLSCEEHGEIDQKPFPNSLPHPIDVSADLHVANETDKPVSGTVFWSLRRPDSSVVREGSFDVTAPAYGGVWCPHLDFNDQDPLEVHLTYSLEVDGKVVSHGSSLFCAPKHYHFADPKLSVKREGNTVTVTSAAFAKCVDIEIPEAVLRLDENFVDLEAGTYTFHVLPGCDFTDPGDCYEGQSVSVRSVFETAER